MSKGDHQKSVTSYLS